MPLNVPLVDTFGPFRQSIGQLTNALQDAPRMQMERLQLGEAQRHQQENQELQQLMARTPATQRPQVAIQFLESKGRTQDAAILKHERFQQFHDQYQIDPQSAITAFPEYGVDPSRASQISTTEIPGTKSVAVRQAGKTSFVQRDPTDAEVQSEATARAKGTMEGGRKTTEELLQDVTQAGAVAGAQEEARQKFKTDQSVSDTELFIKDPEAYKRKKELEAQTSAKYREPKEEDVAAVQSTEGGVPVTKFYTKKQRLAMAASGQGIERPAPAMTQNRITAAQNSYQVGKEILNVLDDPKVKATLGPVMGRVTNLQDLAGILPPAAAKLSGLISSWSKFQGAVHGMRSAEMSEHLEKSLGRRWTPEALAAFIGSYQDTNKIVINSRPGDVVDVPLPSGGGAGGISTAEDYLKKKGIIK